MTPETETKIQKAMASVGWNGTSNKGVPISHISVLVPELKNPFYAMLIDAIAIEGRKRNINVSVGISGGLSTTELEMIDSLSKNPQIDAFMIIGANRLEGLYNFRSITKPWVMVDEEIVCPNKNKGSLVTCDNQNGAYQGVNHLVTQGHREIAFIGGKSELPTAKAREMGFRQAMDFHNIAVNESLVFRGPFNETFGAAVLPELTRRVPRPTAAFVASDIVAIGILSNAEQFSLAIPDDLSIVSCDDIDLCSWLRPRLTSIHQPTESMAKAAFDALEPTEVSTHSRTLLPMHLTVRSSVTPINSKV